MCKVLVLDLSQLEKGIDCLSSKKEEVEDRAKAAGERNEKLMARQVSIEQSMLDRIRADVQTHLQRARLFVDTPSWMQDNTQDVKSPSQSAMDTLIAKCQSVKKPLMVAGCVPQGRRDLKELGVGIVGVQQIDRVVEVAEETLKDHEVRLLNRKTLPALDLPKNKFVEILPINVGCIGACTYCKTKHARGHLGSYTVDSLGFTSRENFKNSDGVSSIFFPCKAGTKFGKDSVEEEIERPPFSINLAVILAGFALEANITKLREK
ncbi:hypothetical protein FNV43_RR11426 [Rhamnella rubrinervis]|uniref:MTTase N-terminal domain-containing protein n=1 Tax=Rhamnella rubrinervis TaxID=2594499 RepID=A0A8K0H5N8_9ROSA|nr:hypothetical protein FNV43_RR11426 [Rhamnella rubrinervis]